MQLPISDSLLGGHQRRPRRIEVTVSRADLTTYVVLLSLRTRYHVLLLVKVVIVEGQPFFWRAMLLNQPKISEIKVTYSLE